jgi:tryptophan-rich sensory protein
MTLKNTLKLIGCVALTLAIGGISGFITKNDITGWYATLVKPGFNPPNYLFGPVWSLLYVLMGVSIYMVISTPPSSNRREGILIFAAQLFLNFWWSIIFFSIHRIDFALAEIVLLWLFILWMILAFLKLRPAAGYLMIPYLLWVSFATALNFAILRLN